MQLPYSRCESNPAIAIKLALAAWPQVKGSDAAFPTAQIVLDTLSKSVVAQRNTLIILAGGPILTVAFSPDGARLLSGGSDHTLRLWDAETGAPVGQPIWGHDGWVWSVAFSPDGTRLLSGSDDGTLRLWGNLVKGNIFQAACRRLPLLNGKRDLSVAGLAEEIGIEDLTLPADCESYDPPLPPEAPR